MTHRWLSLKRVAEMLEISAKTVRRWMVDGTFPQPTMHLPNGQPRWAEVVVLGWAMSREKLPPENPVKGK